MIFLQIRYSLAVPGNKDENEFIRATMDGDSWIGISDNKKEGTFRSVNDNGLVYEKWASGQPDDGGGSMFNILYLYYKFGTKMVIILL